MMVITGFEPFGKFTTNPSWEAVREIEDVKKVKVPVTFRGAVETAKRIAKMDPEIVIATGLSPTTRKIKVEALAINVMHSDLEDNDSFAPKDERIYKDGENCLFTSMPYMDLVQHLNRSGFPSRVSFSAGTYVCNAFYYALLREIPGRRAIFIHVPPTERELENCRDCWKIEEIRQAIEEVKNFTSRLSSP